MVSFRDIKRKARRDLHREMRVPALYIAARGSDPVPVMVRLHTKFTALGDPGGGGFNGAERIEPQPKIIFMRDEIDRPAHNAVVSVEAGEAYRIHHSEPPDDISVTAIVTRMSIEDAVSLPVPVDG